MSQRPGAVVLGAALCAALSIGGLVAATFVKSPAQVAAESRPPAPALLTAPVEHRVLASTLVTRGEVRAAGQVPVAPLGSAQVITAVRTRVGQSVRAGEVLLEVSGRPLIALAGPVPPYRSLKPGDDGRDVTQLQQALRAVGHYRGGDPGGHFGLATKAAISRLYEAVGYPVPMTDGRGGIDDRRALRDAQDAVDQAQRAVTELERRIGTPPTGGPETGEPLDVQLDYLRRTLTRAKEAHAELVARTGPMLPAAEIAFVPRFPARVAALSATVGSPPATPMITLATGALEVVARLRPDQATLLRAGMRVEMVAEAIDGKAVGAVTSVGRLITDEPAAGQGEPSRPYIPVVVTPDAALANGWSGQDVRLTITSAQTAGKVLVVPLSALSAGADGRTTVSKLDERGGVTRIDVVAGISGDGFVAITGAGLAAGDRVVIGR